MGTTSIFLHVGPHKTGSTAIQKALLADRETLAARGVVYPQAGQVDYGHHGLVNHLRGWPASDLDPAALRAELGAAPTAILSSENVVHLSAEALTRLTTILEGMPITVVYYLRRLVDLWPSHWQELIKHGETLSFSDYVSAASLVQKQPSSQVINQMHQLRLLEKAFGRDRLRIVGYDRLRATKTDFARHFLWQIAQVNPEGLTGAEEVNASKSSDLTEFLRLLNTIHIEQTGRKATAALRIATMERLRHDPPPFRARLAELIHARSTPLVIDSATPVVQFLQNRLINAFMDRFDEDPEAVAEAYRAPCQRRIARFAFPVSGEETLRRELLDYYHGLPREARGET